MRQGRPRDGAGAPRLACKEMDSVPFSIVSITFLVGLALIVIALLGGGLEVKEIKLPVLGIFPRLLSFVTGTVLVSLCVFRPDILPMMAMPQLQLHEIHHQLNQPPPPHSPPLRHR